MESIDETYKKEAKLMHSFSLIRCSKLESQNEIGRLITRIRIELGISTLSRQWKFQKKKKKQESRIEDKRKRLTQNQLRNFDFGNRD